LTDINMRSSTLATFDGKDIMVPNERFITTRFVNWTHDDPRQRYEVPFSVAYDTDIHKVAPLIVEAMSRIPGLLSEPELPQCELKAFGDAGVKFVAKFWVMGIDDGKNNYSSDVLYAIWDAMKAANIAMPAPARYVRFEDTSVGKRVK
ncbi:MAG: mechanosensitive ion channel, partial [Alphaproteobacteria bacterium]|nr:mechanosensitive ion channel [Alphaproteobacteria bacterium]